MIPKNWTEFKIKDIANILVGRDLDENHFSKVLTKRHKYPVYSNTVCQKGLYGFYDFEEYKEKGVTVVGRGVGLGTAFARDDGFGAIGRLLVVYPKNNEFDIHYFAAYVNFKLKLHSESGGIPQLTGVGFGNYKIILPPLSQQQKIAEILQTWDKAIQLTELLIEKKERYKKALMQRLLTGRLRLCNFSDSWVISKLQDLYEFKKGRGLSKSEITGSGLNKCVLYGELYTKYKEVITYVFSRTNSKNGIKSLQGDILIPGSTTTSNLDLANATVILENDVLLGGDINILRPRSKSTNSVFMAYLLTHIKKHEIATKAQGITIIHLYCSDLKNIKINFPNILEEQNKISEIILTLDEEIKKIKNKFSCLNSQKIALLHNLLAGDVFIESN